MNRGHLSYSDRLAIETMLAEGYCIGTIAKDIKRASSSIIREIDKHIVFNFPSIYGGQHPCLKWDSCNVKNSRCYSSCKIIEFKRCPKLSKSPHVCNGCTTKSGCRLVKKYYKAKDANDEYKNNLVSSRIGLHYTEFELLILNERLCPLILKSKSVYHSINVINQSFETNFKLKSIYRQINANLLPIKSNDLPRTRRKNKSNKNTDYKRDIEGHTYEDYQDYKNNNPKALETQMDTVQGIIEKDAPVILTLEIIEINFLFMFRINSQSKDEVFKQLTYFKNIIGKDIFDKLMEILLTDNGKEFFILGDLLELAPNVNLFYCHPNSSFEKGSIENNHELIRRVIPKGISLKPYTQADFNLLCSHINSLIRESLNGKSPFDLIQNYIPLKIINKLGLYKVDPLDLCLIPELLGDKNINNIKKYLDDNDIKRANINIKK